MFYDSYNKLTDLFYSSSTFRYAIIKTLLCDGTNTSISCYKDFDHVMKLVIHRPIVSKPKIINHDFQRKNKILALITQNLRNFKTIRLKVVPVTTEFYTRKNKHAVR